MAEETALRKHVKWVFSPLDLVAPWGICLLAVGLCIWGLVAGTPVEGGSKVPMRIVLSLTAAVFAAGIPLWYWFRAIKRKFHYVTKHGIYVVMGKVNKPSKLEVEEWTDEVVEFWTDLEFESGAKKGPRKLSKEEVENALQGLTIFFHDKEALSVLGRLVRGYSWGREIAIGYRPDKPYIRSLVRHEESHPVLGENGEGWDEAYHHQTFTAVKLGA
jgi:hypothetical protein